MQMPPIIKDYLYRLYHGRVRNHGNHPNDILLWPPVKSPEQLADLLPRLQFHFASRRASINRMIIPLTDQSILNEQPDTPYYHGNYIERCHCEFQFPDASRFQGLTLGKAARDYRGVLLTQPADRISGGWWMKYLPNVAPLDPCDVEMETFWVAKLLHFRQRRFLKKNQRRFREFVKRLPKKKKVYLLCTGPSLARYKEFDFSDGYVIACNSVVSNPELMKHAKPDFIVASDPIFHFGPSTYAEQFRLDLAGAAKKFPFLFLTLDSYHHLLETHFALPQKRVAEVPQALTHRMRNMFRHWEVPQTGNIMTMFMMPLAATLARRVYIIGADGREPGEDYFWKHDPNSQLTDQMQAIKDCHPAFFEKRNYEDYYDAHCRVVQKQVDQIEKRNGRVYTLTPSHIPALKNKLAKQEKG